MNSLPSSVIQDEKLTSRADELFAPNIGIAQPNKGSLNGRNVVVSHLCQGEVTEVCKRMEQVLKFGRSTDFNEGGLSESGLKMVLFGLLASQNENDKWEILSEEEIGSSGYADVVLKQTTGRDVIIIELKYVRAAHLLLHHNNNAANISSREGLEKSLIDIEKLSIDQLKSQKSKTWTKGDRTIQFQIKDAVIQCQRYAKGWNQQDTVRSVVLMGIGKRVLGFTWAGECHLPEDANNWEESVEEQNKSLWVGLENNDIALVTKALDAGATLDCQKGIFFSPLHFAVTQGYEKMSSFLVERGGCIWLKDTFGRHPIDIALDSGNASVFRLLTNSNNKLENDSQVSKWPLDWAKMKEEEDSLRIEFVGAGKALRMGCALLKPIFNLQLPKLAHNVPTIFPSIDPLPLGEQSVVDKSTFEKHWNILTDDLFGPDFPWSNVFSAGGAVLGCCLPLSSEDMKNPKTYFKDTSPFRGGDVDLFICGLTPVEATQKAREIMEYFKRTRNNPLFIRTKNCITIIPGEGLKQVQIVLRCYQNPVEVLMGFDIDCCSVGYNGSEVLAIPRAIRALQYRINVLDASRQSTTYCQRFEKYAKRGFIVGVPGLDRDKINPEIYSKPLKKLVGIAKLLVLESGRIEEETSLASDYEAFAVIPKSGSPNDIHTILTKQTCKFVKGAHFIHSFDIEDILSIPNDFRMNDSVAKQLKNSWLVENPGKQLTGSFQPTKDNLWLDVLKE